MRDTVREFVDDRSCRTSPTGSRTARCPPRARAASSASSACSGMHLEGYGCAGTSATAYGLACLELEAGDSGIRTFVSVQGSLAMFAIWQLRARRSRSRSGCPGWPPARRSAASA